MPLIRVLAPNPGPYTGPGTNTYVFIDGGEALVLDPGPVIGEHRIEIVAALAGATPVGVVATHTHPDHAPLANPLAAELDVPVYGYGPGPEFAPDRTVDDGDSIRVGSRALVTVHTPGHTADHLCFLSEGTLYTGDHIMGGSTVVIEDAAAYMESLYKVRDLGASRIEPGHGPTLDDAGAVIEEYIDHRTMRERQLVTAIGAGATTVGDLVAVVYVGIPEEVIPAAVHQVVVQLTKLSHDGVVRFDQGGANATTVVELTGRIP